MSGPPSRAPANKVGGKRRRLTRPPVQRPPAGVPRSNTLPVIPFESASGAGTQAFARGTSGGPGGRAPHGGARIGGDSTLSTEESSTTVGNTYFTYEEGATSLEESMLHFPPPAGVPVDHRRKPSQGGSVGRDEVSPRPTATSNNSSGTLTAEGNSKKTTDGKKKQKHGGLTINNPFRSTSRQNLEQTPLPPATPTKAAKLLGLAEPANDARPKTAQGDGIGYEVRPGTAKNDNSAFDGVDEEEHRGRRQLPSQSSMPFLGSPYSASGNDPFDDIIVESDDDDHDDRKTSKPKGFLQSSKKMAKKMSVPNFKDFFTARTENPSSIDVISPEYRKYVNNEADLLGDHRYAHVSNEQRSPERALPPLPSQAPISHSENGYGKKSKSNRSRKQRSQVDRMAPVTEASRDDMRSAFLDGEDDTWVHVASDSARADSTSGGPVRPPRNESLASSHTGPYGLSTDELSAGNDDTDEYEAEDEKPLLAKNKGKAVKKNELPTIQPPAFHLRSPLQNVEDRLLDVAEKSLEGMKLSKPEEQESPEESHETQESPSESSAVTQSSTAYRNIFTAATESPYFVPSEAMVDELTLLRKNNEAKKMLLDYQMNQLKTSHQEMKNDFAPYAAKKTSENDEKEGSGSIRSSIDLDEEPTVHTAKAMPFVRVVPGMVKLVDIPPRKKKTT